MMTYVTPDSGNMPYKIYGTSSDEKPTDAANATIFFEMDTKKVYMFDEDATTWREV